jgi:hypothetical protein
MRTKKDIKNGIFGHSERFLMSKYVLNSKYDCPGGVV